MLIIDIESLEILSEEESVGGGALQLFVNDDLTDESLAITLGVDDQPLLSRRLSNGDSLNYKFFGRTSGSLTAQRQKNNNQLTQSVSLVGKTEDGVNFSFSSNYITKLG
jgi:hypothetical protein